MAKSYIILEETHLFCSLYQSRSHSTPTKHPPPTTFDDPVFFLVAGSRSPCLSQIREQMLRENPGTARSVSDLWDQRRLRWRDVRVLTPRTKVIGELLS